MNWVNVAPDGAAETLRRLLLGAFTRAWAANVERYQPEELGDTPLNFGLNVTMNARHLAAEAVHDVPNITDRELRQLRWFETSGDRQHRLFVYKAPPGATSVAEVSFSDSQIKKELTTANAAQLALPVDGAAEPNVENVVIVMFGDPVVGFERAVIGAPYLHRFQKGKSPKIYEEVCWAWTEPFGDADYGSGMQPAPIQKTPPPDDDLPVRLRPVADLDTEEEVG